MRSTLLQLFFQVPGKPYADLIFLTVHKCSALLTQASRRTKISLLSER